MALLDKDNSLENRKAWQEFLNTQGFNLKVDGDWGTHTEDATLQFQRKNKLTADGDVGTDTLAAARSLGFLGFDLGKLTVLKQITTPATSAQNLFDGSRVDKINAAALAKVSPILQKKAQLFLDAAKADGVTLQVVQGLRTFAEQDALFAQGRTRAGDRVTNARGGQSNHNFGVAIDVAPVVGGKVSWDDKLYKPYGKWADAAGLSWGGRWKKFKDMPHLEYTGNLKLKDIQALYRQGGLASVWKGVK